MIPRAPRVRLDEAYGPARGAVVAVPVASAHHLTRVLRLGPGDAVEVVDGEGALFGGRLVAGEPLCVEIGAALGVADADARTELEVWMPLLKGGRSDALVRQLTELGVTAIVGFASERTVVRWDAERGRRRVERWLAIATEATRQCRRTDVPGVRLSPTLPGPGDGHGVFLWEEPGSRGPEVFAERRVDRILVGPEGGLAESEAAGLAAAGWTGIWLGPRILRAETAVVAAATLALFTAR